MKAIDVRIERESREDGSQYISSPDVPLFHILLRPGEGMVEVCLPILYRMVGSQHNEPISLHLIDTGLPGGQTDMGAG